MTDNNIAVGDILYLVSNKHRQVIPLRVVEQINRRTLEGETVSYLVKLFDLEKTVDLSTLRPSGDIFLTLDDVRTSLREKALRAIDEVIANAEKIAIEHFQAESKTEISDEGAEEHSAVSVPVSAPQSMKPAAKVYRRQQQDDAVTVTLPDGSRAKFVQPGV